ncbi:RHS repeat-associated core domain-containing protein [Corynebacterium matruchotii]|uniref:RHS repeat-associated core domain-containing protein n=1 Tax=Corynebacterium matruchotii TaxID=43768 RepID=UPI0028E6C370|nr:RHS repeat-associated core domain-containing protein [Corynebacterium matruchotii]
MPVLPLKPFLAYKQNEFRIGGNPAEVFEFARRWRVFAENALTTAASLRAMNDGGFLGDEGDRYRELIHGEFPNHLTITGEAHRGVSTAVTQYAEALTSAQTQMNALTAIAMADHTAVQTAVANYNLCEANVVRAAATAKVATATAVATAALPGVNAITASTATAAQSELAAAQAAFEAAKAEHLRATTVFDADVAKGAGIKATLSMEVNTAVAWIKTQARRRFEENPSWLQEKWEAFKDWVTKHSKEISDISDALQLIGALLAFTPLAPLGVFLELVGVALKGLLWLTGNCSWQEFGFDLITCLPGGKIFKALKGTRPGKALSKAAKAAKAKAGKHGAKLLSRGNKCKHPGLEPVDMATGAMIDSATDIHIDGILPMVVARNTDSNMDTSRIFGPGWNTTLDCRIEILPDQVLMMTPDGALLEFPPAPVDGTEVGDAGRPWRLCFVDGAYRVRNISEGVTYVFGIAGSEAQGGKPCYQPDGPVPDHTITGDAPKNYVYCLDEETGELVRRERTINNDVQHSDGVAGKDRSDGGAESVTDTSTSDDSTDAFTSNVHNSAAPVNDSAVSQNSSDKDQADTDDAANPQDDSGTANEADNTGSGVWEASNSFVNMLASGSVADTFNLGVEVQLSTMVHHSGAWIEYNYEQETGHLVAMRRSDGTVLELKWHNRISRLLSIWVRNEETHPGSEPFRLASYNYDGKGRLLKVINSAAGALRYFYDDEHRPTRWTDRNGHSYHYRFDDKGRVIAQVGSGGMFPNIAVWLPDTGDDAPEDGMVCVALECAGKFHGNPTEIGDTCINEYFDRLDKLPLANLLREKGLVGAGLTGRGRVGVRDDKPWSLSDELLRDEFLGDIRPTVYRSTPTGDVWRIITPEGVVTDREYDEHHQIIKEVSNTGVVTTIGRDEYGTITRIDFGDGTTETITPGAWGEPAQVTGRDGFTTEYEIDAAGMVTAVTDPLGVVTRFEYDWRATGIVPKATVTPNGLVRTMECDNAGRPIASTDPAGRRSSVTRDVRGLVTEVIDPVGNVTTIEYSPEGWVTKVITPDGSERSATYDGEGNLTQAMSETGAKTTTRYTVFDKISSVTLPNGGVTRYSYNTQMEPITVTNADGHTWQLHYDLDGSIIKEIDYNGLITQSHATPDGSQLNITTGAGTVTTMFDLYGRMTETFDDQGNATAYQWDALGKITKVTNRWCTTDYSYDEYGRSLTETTTLYSGESHTMAFTYGRLGGVEMITHTLPDGKQVSETPMFDDEGVLRNSTYKLGDVEVASLSFGVDDTGRRSWSHVGSLVRSFSYDRNSRLVRDQVHALTPGNKQHGADPTNATARNSAGHNESLQHQDEYHAVGVIDRVFTWRADDVITQITDQIRGVETSYDVDPMGRVTRVTHQHAGGNTSQGDRAGSSSQAQYSQAGFGQNQSNQCMPGGEESYSYSQAGVLTKLHPDTTTRWADDVDSYGGTMPHQVGRTKFTYDKAGRVTQTVTKRLSKKPLVKHFYYDNGTQPVGYEDSDHPGVGWRYLYDGACRRVGKEQINTTTGEVTNQIMFLHEGDVLFGEYHTVNTMNPHMVGSAVLWPTDPGTGEILGQITINTNTSITDSVTSHGDGTGHYPGSYSGDTGGNNNADDPYSQHNNPHGGYNGGPYHHDASATGDGAGGVLGWPQQRVDAVFYSMVCDLAGAPKELINPTTGEVVGYATYTLFGKRHWAGTVNTPLLFTGQYEDTESGWVYNRFRYYDPHAGVYNAQDPLGLLANLGTAQGYVTNPVTWVDVLGLYGCENISKYMQHYIDAFQTRVLYSVYQVGSKFTCSRVTLAMAKIEVTFVKDGIEKTKILTVAATSGKDGDVLSKYFSPYLPADVYRLDTMVTPNRLLPNGKYAKKGHAEESIINWFYDAKDKLFVKHEKVELVGGEILDKEGAVIGTEKHVLYPGEVTSIRVKELAASRAICNRVCTQKVVDLDADMFKELNQADSTGAAEGAEKIQKMEKAAEEVSQRKVAKLKEKTGFQQRYVQEGVNGLKAVHTPTPFEKLVNPKLK